MYKALRTIFLLLVMVVTAVYAPQSVSAQDSRFVPLGDSEFLYIDPQPARFAINGEPVQLIMDRRTGVLRLFDASGKKDYLSFTGYYGDNGGIGYTVRKIALTDPGKQFIEIIASQGAKGKNAGYWLIGKHDGKWVTYVSLDSLASMGYTTDEWHGINSIINSDGDGRFIIESFHRYMPPGAQYGYQEKIAVDLRVELTWDKNARWFAMRSI